MKTVAATYLGLIILLMGSATVLATTELLFCSQKDRPTFCQPINSIMSAFRGY
ncbi:MAG TPA: hypothetical protein V6D25_12200 [Leptolyngbyaceae cyanobacterium]